MSNKNSIINLIISLSFIIIVGLIYYIFPNIEFKTATLNRIFGVFFNIFFIYTCLIIIKNTKLLDNVYLKYAILILNGLFLFISLINLPLYLLKIDPQVQYFDIETLYYSKENKFDKIEKQYYVNWKNNLKDTIVNNVSDFGPFRKFNEYDVDINKLDSKWQKIK
ncbi:hypothetical protein [Epilithonimonas sp.]|uniref:hypothetical protein n=1 Tax=Epilithonimonas sp. TaxID=2894511 RepID=UPI00289EFBD2|nr:hypothetical protein [Epilithonimonas sp.]